MAKKKQTVTWGAIEKISADLVSRLSGDRFLKAVLSGCVRVGRDRGNQIRGNLVAAGLREIVGHVLHTLAPDDEVRACGWFVQDMHTPTVTRKQRASYIVRAGLPDDFMKERLQIEVDDYVSPLIKAMDALNRATHVRPDTILIQGAAIKTLYLNVLSGIDGLLDAADHSRDTVRHAIVGAMHDAVFDSLISETIQELDELSTHTVVDGHWIESVKVEHIDARKISYRITGHVEAELQYGSNSDVENDIGYRQSASYPYKARVVGNAADPMALDADNVSLHVDNSSFYD